MAIFHKFSSRRMLIRIAGAILIAFAIFGIRIASYPLYYEKAHRASRDGDIDALRITIANDPDCIHRRDRGGMTPILKAARNGKLEAVQILLKHGASLSDTWSPASNDGDWTPLHTAAGFGHIEVVRFLLDNGSDPTAVTLAGDTAAELAIKRGKYDVVELFRTHSVAKP